MHPFPIPSTLNQQHVRHAEVAKLADAPDLGSGAARRRGSSPLFRTKLQAECCCLCFWRPMPTITQPDNTVITLNKNCRLPRLLRQQRSRSASPSGTSSSSLARLEQQTPAGRHRRKLPGRLPQPAAGQGPATASLPRTSSSTSRTSAPSHSIIRQQPDRRPASSPASSSQSTRARGVCRTMTAIGFLVVIPEGNLLYAGTSRAL